MLRSIPSFLGLLLTFGASLAVAQEPPTPGGTLKFAINGFRVEGSSLLSSDLIERSLAPFVGQDKDFGVVQQALAALEKLFAEAGYSVVQVQLPEQELDRGVVRFRVIEGRLMSTRYEGNRYFSDANVGRSLAALKAGQTPNVLDLAENLRLINENPAKQTVVTLKAGRDEGELEAVAKTTDQDPVRFAMSLDNSGTASTGKYRLGIAMQNANLFDRDQVLSIQYITSPDDHLKQVSIFGAGYQVPIYEWNGAFGFFYGTSNVDAGRVDTAAGNYMIAGRGSLVGLRYTQNLRKRGNWETSLTVGLDFRAYESRVSAVGSQTNLVPDVTVHPVSLTYSASYRQPEFDFSTYFSAVQNLPGGSDAGDAAFQQNGQRPGANSRYLLYRYGANAAWMLASDWQLRAAFSGQHTNQMLISGEQFGVGGAESVRGYLEREIANDRGHRGSVELYTPDWGSGLVEAARMRTLVFYDFGYVKRLLPALREAPGAAIASYGIGLRGGYGKSVGFRLDFAKVADKGNDQTRGVRMHGALSYLF